MQLVSTISKNSMPSAMFCVWLANVRMIQAARKTGKTPPPTLMPLFWGGVGVGKSSIIKGFAAFHAEKFGKPFFTGGVQKLNLASMDGGDFEIPVADHSAGVIRRLCALQFAKSPQIFLVDEINRFLTHDGINAFSRIILDRDGAQAPADGSFVVACANTLSCGGTKELPEHIVNRACHLYLSEDGENSSNVDYLRMACTAAPDWFFDTLEMSPYVSRDDHDEMGKETPRSREFAAWIIVAANDCATFTVEISDNLLFALIAGVCGQAFASKVMAARKLARLPTLADVIASPETVAIPDSSVDHGLRKSHALHLIASLGNSSNEAVRLLQYFLRFTSEFQRYAIESLLDKVPTLSTRADYIAWAKR